MRILYWTVAILVAVAVLGFLVAPLLVKPALERQLSAALNRNVTIAKLDINPFAGSATLHEISISERGEGPPMLTLAELYVNGEIASLFRWAPVISELKLTKPALNVVRNADKTYNISDLIDQALAPGPTPRFSLSNIEVIGGRITFEDRPEHKQHEVTELTIGIPFLSSLPTQTEIKVEPRLSALVNGRPVGVTGETRPFKDTHETLLHWDLGDLPLPTYIDYVPFELPLKLESGQLSGILDFSFVGRGSDPPQLTLAGAFRLTDLVLSERSGAKLLRVPSLAFAVDRVDLTGRRADLGSVAADGVELEISRDAGGELNLAKLVPSGSGPGSRQQPFPFRVASIAVNHGTVRLADESVKPAFSSTLNEVVIRVSNLASAPDEKASVTFSFVSNTGARLSQQGTLALTPIRADSRLELTGFHLALLFPYYTSALNLAVDDGTLDASTDVHYDGSAASPLTLASLEATANNLKMRLPDEKEPLWRIPVLAAHGGFVEVSKHVINFESIESRGAVATMRRYADGSINFGRLIRTQERGAAPTAGGEAWHVETNKVALDDFSATFTDETVTPAARIALSQVSLSGDNLSRVATGRGQATLKATVGRRGTIALAGPVATAPFGGTLNVVAKDIDLVPFGPYLSREARVVVTGGTASARGRVDFGTGTTPHTGFKGDLVLGGVTVLDEANQADLLKWKSLTLANVDAQLEPLAVSVSEITLGDFFARLLLNENGEFNLQQLERARAPAAAPPTPTAQPNTVQVATPPGTATTWLRLGKATLTGGNVDFTDHFIRPNYSANLTGIAGSLSSLAFDKPADMELRGSVQGSAPVEITGQINPLAENLFLDVKASATDIDLPPLTPYSGKYVGYGIEKGKLSMKVSYLVDNRKLKAENSIVLDQLTFGQKVESPDAIKAPVLLAVALLKDRNGVIRFDLPVSGSIDDPKFSVGALVFRALVNLILKVVTAPFALLGALSGHGEQLAYIEFAPGSALIDPPGESKIKAVGKALVDRPAVKLDIAGRVDPVQDREGLKRASVDRQVKQQKFNDLARSGQPPASVDSVEVPPSEYEPLLTRAYKAADFPKPRNAIGLPKDLPRDEMETLLLANAKVSDEDLRLLAEHRAQAVRSSLIEGEHVPGERVFLVAPRLDAQGLKDNGKPTRVDFVLH